MLLTEPVGGSIGKMLNLCYAAATILRVGAAEHPQTLAINNSRASAYVTGTGPCVTFHLRLADGSEFDVRVNCTREPDPAD